MKAGTLRHRLTIEENTPGTANAYGEQAATWSTLASVWAAVSPLSAKEAEHAKRFGETVNHKVTIRYRDDVSARHRIRWGSRILNINGVINADERNRELWLFCTEAKS